MILQLNPQIPVITKDKGSALAFLVIDYSEEQNLIFTVALDSNGEIWSFPSTELRFQKNITMGRIPKQELA